MQVILANPRGFCAGVDRAIQIVSEDEFEPIVLIEPCTQEFIPGYAPNTFSLGGPSYNPSCTPPHPGL